MNEDDAIELRPWRWRRRGPDGVKAVEAEIMQEKADALGRAGRRLEEALDALERVREAVSGVEALLRCRSGLPDEAASLRAAHTDLTARLNVLNERAQQAYQYLIIHREAIGMRNHLDVERAYRLSERLR